MDEETKNTKNESPELEDLIRAFQNFNKSRHSDHYELKATLDHNLEKIIKIMDERIESFPADEISKLSSTVEKLPDELGKKIRDTVKEAEENMSKTFNQNSAPLIESVKSMEEKLIEQIEEIPVTIENAMTDTGEVFKESIGEIKEELTQAIESNKAITEKFNQSMEELSSEIKSIFEVIKDYTEEFKKEREEFEILKKENEARRLNDIAVKNYYSGRTELALKRLKEALDLNEDSPEILSNLGIVLSNEGNKNEAKRIFSKLIDEYPELSEAISGMGLLLFDEGEIDEAIEYFEEAIQKNKNYAPAYANLGYAYEEKEDLDRAIEYWEKAVEIDPTLTEVKESLSIYKERRVDGEGEIPV